MSFADNFKGARNKLGISQEELARKLHISRQAISRYENGTAEPSIDMLNDISIILEISIESLLDAKREISEYKEFEFLPKDDRVMFFYDFSALHRWNMYFLPFMFLLLMNMGIGIATFGILKILSANVSIEVYIFLVIGALIISACAIFLLINNSLMTSRKFNKWLRQHNVIRKKKIMFL